MTSERIRQIIQGLIRLTAAAVLLGIVVFFAATRTQVGRDQVAKQIEVAVSNRFAGELTIGGMTGNLAQTLFATHIVLHDPQGRPVISVDSIVASPRWASLVRRDFSVGKLEIHGLAVTLYPESDSTARSSLHAALSVADSSRAAAPGRGSWSMMGASVHVFDANVQAGSAEAARMLPRPTWWRWLSDRPVDIKNANLDVVWAPSRKQIDILNFESSFTRQELTTSEVRAQIRVDDDRISIPDAALWLGGSQVHAAGHISRSDTPPSFQLEITPSVLQTDELHRLIPAIPSRGEVEIGAMIQGSIADLTIPWLDITHNASSLHAEGTIIGLPTSADFELSVGSDQLELDVIRLWAPNSPALDAVRVSTIAMDSYFRGQIPSIQHLVDDPLTGWMANGNVDVASDAGTVALSFDIGALERDATTHSIRARSSGFDLGPWLGRTTLQTNLTGTFSASGTGLHPEEIMSSVSLELDSPRWNDKFLENLNATYEHMPSAWSAQATLTQRNGTMNLGGSWEHGQLVHFSGHLERMDVGDLLGLDTWQSQVTLDLETDFTPFWSDSSRFAITLDVDSSWVAQHGARHQLPPQEIFAQFSPPGDDGTTGVFQFTSPSLRLTADSEAPLHAVMPAFTYWRSRMREAAGRAGDKWLQPDGNTRDPSTLVLQAGKELAQTQAAALAPVAVHLGVDVDDASLLTAFRPAADSLSLTGTADVNVLIGADTLSAVSKGHFQGARLGSLLLHGIQTEWRLATSRVGSNATAPMPLTTSHLALSIDSLSRGMLTTGHARLEASMRNSRGNVDVHVLRPGLTDSLYMSAGLYLLPETNRLRLQTIALHAGPSEWFLKSPASIDFFADATRIQDLQIALRNENGLTEQSFSAAGTFSAYEDDLLRVNANELLMTDLSDYLNIGKRIGGRLNAAVDLAGGYTQPRASGQVRLDNASLEHHIVGDVVIRSDFVSDSPDLDFSLDIDPIESDSVYISGRDELGSVVENDLSFAGTIRLPGRTDTDEGRVDLDADLEHVNLFFLEYIFNQAIANADGFLVGDGRITGTLFQPVIEGRAAALDGTFDIPRTGLTYMLEGDMRVDREAIHFERALAQDQQGGTALITGRLNFNNYREFTLDLSGTLDEFQVLGSGTANDLPFYGFVWASGTLSLNGPLYDAMLRSTDAVTRPDSRLFIPIEETLSETDESFIVFEDTPGVIPDFDALARRPFLLSRRPTAERQFIDALNMDLSIRAPTGSVVHLVIDPLLGDVIEASSEGSIQLVREDGEFSVFGTLEVNSGKYLFTAGEVFQRNFQISEGGTMTWDGDPLNAALDINASYRTRASLRGLDNTENDSRLVPMIVLLHITGTVFSPEIGLSLAIDQSNQNVLGNYQALEARLNQPELATEYATSVMLTNSFILTTDNISSDSGGQLAFNSVSQLVSSQLNRFLNAALPNVDFSFGLQGENRQDLDVTYGVALRLLDERLIIRGEGVYQGARSSSDIRANDGLQGEFVVEVRLNSNVSLEVFYRREGDILQSTELTNTGGIGISYQTEFTGWRHLFSSPSPTPEQSAQ